MYKPKNNLIYKPCGRILHYPYIKRCWILYNVCTQISCFIYQNNDFEL